MKKPAALERHEKRAKGAACRFFARYGVELALKAALDEIDRYDTGPKFRKKFARKLLRKAESLQAQ